MYEILKACTDPVCLLHFLFVVVFIFTYRRTDRDHRRPLRWLAGVWGLFFLLSLPVVGHFFRSVLESQNPPISDVSKVDVIVLLGGGRIPPEIDGELTLPSESGLVRCRRALWVYQQLDGEAKLIICGGKTRPEEAGTSEADAMADFFLSHDVPDEQIILEDRSRSTYENARFASESIPEGARVGLVTSGLHLYRAKICFEKFGASVVPVGCDYSEWDPNPIMWWIPNVGALSDIQSSLHEWLGLVWYKVSGKI